MQKVPFFRVACGFFCATLLSLIILPLLASCAGQVYPSGGPPDTIPPTVIRTSPDTNSVHVEADKIELEFSEYVERRSVEESIFISPYVGKLEFEWGTTDVTIYPSEKLKKNRTYVLNVGTDVLDVRNKNRMASGFTLAFSTGDSIDQGFIKGRVFDEKAEGVMVFAYALAGVNADTLDPTSLKPDYIQQTGKDGRFTLANIAFGTYRLIAVRDEYRNLVYDRQIDQFGVATGDILVDAQRPQVQDVWFYLSKEDTAKPFLTNVTAMTRNHLRARFSEPLDSATFDQSVFALSDTLSGVQQEITLKYIDRNAPADVGIIVSAPLDSGKAYRLHVANAFDRIGNRIDTANARIAFLGVATPDTMKPTLVVVGLSDSARNVPLDKGIEIQFSKPVVMKPALGAVMLQDSAKKLVPAGIRSLGATSIIVTPTQPLKSKAWYRLSVRLDSVKDYQGNGFKKDSTVILRFETFDLRTTGTLEGIVVDDETGEGLGDVYVTVNGLDTRTSGERTVRLKSPGKFVMENLPEGRYTLRAFRDVDTSGAYTYGRPFPFIPAERFAIYPDTVRVRARWGVEGVTIRFTARPHATGRPDTSKSGSALDKPPASVPEQTPEPKSAPLKKSPKNKNAKDKKK